MAVGNDVQVRLVAGDVVIVPHGDAHVMSSALGLVPMEEEILSLVELLSRRPAELSHGGGGAPTRLICGYLACDARLARMLLTGLPPLLRVNLRGSGAGAWLESSMQYALAQASSPLPGGAGVLSKLAEVLFIEVLRQYMHESPEDRTGWLAGVGDRVIGTVLSSMHQRPSYPWTLPELARVAGTSRSVLAERFQKLVGLSPMQYLTQWRMVLAANMLRHSNAPLLRIAQDVGYHCIQSCIPPRIWSATGNLATAPRCLGAGRQFTNPRPREGEPRSTGSPGVPT